MYKLIYILLFRPIEQDCDMVVENNTVHKLAALPLSESKNMFLLIGTSDLCELDPLTTAYKILDFSGTLIRTLNNRHVGLI